MKKTYSVIYWASRVLGIGLILFISVFALDVFDESHGFWNTMLALLIHLIPSYILIIVFIVACKWKLAGTILYFALGLLYIIIARGNSPLLVYFIISGPLFLTGILFFILARVKLPEV